MIPTSKVCTQCRRRKPIALFDRGKGYKDGVRSACKSCRQTETNANKRKAARRRCSKCDELKEAGAFSRSKNARVWCKACCRANAAAWRARNPAKVAQHNRRPRNSAREKEVQRIYRLLAKYGMTIEEYEALLKKQDGVCAICKEPPQDNLTRFGVLHVDHCHTTKKVRGLLCGLCNTALGGFREKITILQAAINYLVEC